jgi:streptomycin 3"-adenylyltransferase
VTIAAIDVPADVQAQLDALVTTLRETTRGSLVGVYLHGSLALGCFHPERSDVDVLALTSRPTTATERRTLAASLSDISAPKSWPRAGRYPLELTLLCERDVRPWRHPTRFEVHYSESRGATGPGEDTDLATHLTILHHAGVVLEGPPVAETFPRVPWEDYVGALRSDLDRCRDQGTNFYAVLSPARVWATIAAKTPHSKESGALWALPRLPEGLQPLLATALAIYRGERGWHDFEPEAVRAYLDWIESRLAGAWHSRPRPGERRPRPGSAQPASAIAAS